MYLLRPLTLVFFPYIPGPINDITSEPDNDTPQMTDDESQIQCGSCMVTALTAGVVSVIITALLVSGISVAIHIVVY